PHTESTPPATESDGGTDISSMVKPSPIYIVGCQGCHRLIVRYRRFPTKEEMAEAYRKWLAAKGVDVDTLMAEGRKLPQPGPREHIFPRPRWLTVTQADYTAYVRGLPSAFLRTAIIEGFHRAGVPIFPPSMRAESPPFGP
ncbi:MAG: hypothetical protein ACREB9_07990, partial [Thermoplasmata archaeon]